MEVARSFVGRYPNGGAAYLRLQAALVRRHVARGGTAEDFCARLAPAFRRRWGPLLLGEVPREGCATPARRAA